MVNRLVLIQCFLLWALFLLCSFYISALCNFRTHLKSDGWMFISWTGIFGVLTGADRDQTTNLPNSRWPFLLPELQPPQPSERSDAPERSAQLICQHLSGDVLGLCLILVDFLIPLTSCRLFLLLFYFVLHFSSFLNFFYEHSAHHAKI